MENKNLEENVLGHDIGTNDPTSYMVEMTKLSKEYSGSKVLSDIASTLLGKYGNNSTVDWNSRIQSVNKIIGTNRNQLLCSPLEDFDRIMRVVKKNDYAVKNYGNMFVGFYDKLLN